MTRDMEPEARPRTKLGRPRKKLSFRDPEIVGCDKYRQMKERPEQRTESIIKSGRTEGDGASDRPALRHETNASLDMSDQVPSPPDSASPGSADSSSTTRQIFELVPLAHRAAPGGSIEDLCLEDQTLAVVRSVEDAFEQYGYSAARDLYHCSAARDLYHSSTAPQSSLLAAPVHSDQPSDTDSQRSGDEPRAQTDGESVIIRQRYKSEPELAPAPATSVHPIDAPSPENGHLAAARATQLPRIASELAADGRRQSRRHRHSRPAHLPLVSPTAPERRYLQTRQLQQLALDTLCPLQTAPDALYPLLELTHDQLPLMPKAAGAVSLLHQIQLIRGQQAQQRQQTTAALAQAHLVRDQLQAETAARLEAQLRSHQLLHHNRQLLQHVETLVGELHELEVGSPEVASPGTSSASLSSDELRRPRHRLT